MATAWENRIDLLVPVVWLKLDGSGTPSNSGTMSVSFTQYNDAPTTGVSGKVSNAYTFNGNSGYTSTSNFPSNTFDDKTFSVEVWAKWGDITTNTFPSFFRGWTAVGTRDQILCRAIDNPNDANNGKVQFYMRGATTEEGIYSTSTLNDNNWHHIVFTCDGNTKKIYVDGDLETTGTVNVGTFALDSASSRTWMFAGGKDNEDFDGTIDEFIIYDFTLSAEQVENNYIAAFSYNNDASPMTTASPHSELVMPTFSAGTGAQIDSDEFTATAESVFPAVSLDVNVDAFGVSTASADIVHPTFDTTRSVDYAADPQTASADIVHPTVSAQIYLSYSASPATASALLAGNVYAGPTVQDTSYHVTLRQVNTTTNTDGKNGFFIGSQWSNNNLDNRVSLAIKATTGIPNAGTLIKVRFDSSHITAVTSGNQKDPNTFKVYVFTENPSTTFDTMTYANLPAKELLYTTRYQDSDGQYIDLTTAFRDSRAATYGIFVEHAEELPYGSGTYYDRTEYTGTNLEHKLFYILTSDFLNININVAPSTATAEFTAVTLDVQKYVDFQDGVAEATADIVHPVISIEISNEYTSGTLDASAEAVQPTFSATVGYTSDHLEADARMGLSDPIIYAEGTATLSADPMTADALFHDPQTQIGEENTVASMDGSALFVDPTLIINEFVDAMVTTASVEMVDPTIGGELLGTIFATPMTASAFSPLPPAYIDLTQDEWFNRLYALDAQSSIIDTLGQHIGVLKFFTESTNITTSTVVAGNGYDEGVGVTGLSAISYLNSVTTPTPLGIVGEFDPYERKAVNLRNISLAWQNIQTGSSDVRSSTDRGFTTELFMKTTKANQILFYGTRASATTTSFDHSFIGLNNGKIYIKTPSTAALTISATTVINTTPIIETSKNVADGQWHHILIQNGYDNRTQIWIDGNLEIQRYGYFYPRPLAIGYNSDNANLSSDFLVSGFSSNAGQFILERDIDLNYYAAIKYQPIFAEPMTASIASGDHRAGGNRRRALMLYWWEASARNQFARVSDNGRYGVYDYETFDNALDTNVETQQYYGWDVFSVNVQGDIRSNIVKPGAYGTGIGGFRDPITDNRRYIDVMNDLDLSQFDAIFFRNYPDQTPELDANTRNEAVDPLLGIIENDIYEKFLEDLRKAVDTGISLYVTNTQLAVDLGIVDRIEEFRDLQESNGGAYAQELTGINYGTSGRQGYKDTHTPASFMKVINTIPGLTDHATYIWKDAAYWDNDDTVDFGGADRPFEKFDYRENGLIVGDIIKVSDTNEYYQPRTYLQAVPLANVKAGKAITTYAPTYKNGTNEIPNPYANYALHVAVEPGDILKGTQCGGKIFVNFTEKFPGASANLASPTYGYEAKEFGQVDLVTDYWINAAYEMGKIDLNTKNTYLNASYNLNRQLEAAELAGNAALIDQLNKKIYWSFHPDYILAQRNANVSNIVVQSGSIGNESVSNRSQNVVNPQTGQAVSWRQEVFFTFKYSRQYPTMTIEIPSMAIRGFWWLAERVVPVGLVERPVAGTASATMQMPQVSADKEIAYNAQAMVALANSVFPTNYTSNDVSVGSLPFAAQATMVNLTTRIAAATMTASALNIEPGILTSSTDEIVLYLHHVDPILYLREEIIK